jgi:hypothetical protein
MLLLGLQFFSGIQLLIHRSMIKVEHPGDSSFPELEQLLKSVVKDGRVDYASAKNSRLLEDAVRRLEAISPDRIEAPRERLCFWINAYNLLVIKEIADRFPIKSVKQLGNDPHLRKFLVGGMPYTLQEIHVNEIMPLLQGNPNAAFLICGGAVGHPQLMDHALKGSSLQSDSEAAAQRFIRNPGNVNYNLEHSVVAISPWFIWYNSILSKKYGSSENLIDSYLTPQQQSVFEQSMVKKSFGKDFNWNINKRESVKK